MEKSSRDALKVGASAVMGAVMVNLQASENAVAGETGAGSGVKSIPPLSSLAGVRLVSCLFKGATTPSVGLVLDDGRVIDLAAQTKRQNTPLSFAADSMIALIAGWDAALAQAITVGERARRSGIVFPALDSVRLLSPIPTPARNIYCVGWNYLDHFEEGKHARIDKVVDKLPDHPVFFTKGTHTMNGPFDPIPHDASNSTTTDWEAELAVVIGKRGRNISEADAMNYVFGYSAYNDTTEREIQQKRHGAQWFKGKSLDGHGPMGPWIVSAAGVNLDEVRVICRVNGVEKQNASYQQMYFKIPRIIAELSRGMTLEPGDIIATGTPSGVGFARTPQEFLRPGDVMETEIVGVGTIRNLIKAET